MGQPARTKERSTGAPAAQAGAGAGSRDEANGVPLVAALLSWFLPGAGHLYLGRGTYAAVACVVVVGLYALGYLLSDGLVFQFLDPELRSMTAIALTPEVGNLGSLVWHWQSRPAVAFPFTPAVYPATVHLGGILTAASGVLGALLVSDAHWAARVRTAPARSPALDAALTWVLPGLGHFRQGRRLRGVIVFAVLVGVFAAGCFLCEGTNLSRERHFYYWSGQFLLGGPAIAAELIAGERAVTGPIRLVDVGLYYGALAGLLNVLAMIDAYAFAESRGMGLDPVADRRARLEDGKDEVAESSAGAAGKHLVGQAPPAAGQGGQP